MTNRSGYDSSDPNDVKEYRETADSVHLRRLRDINEILNLESGAGIRFFQEMFKAGHIEGAIFTGNSSTYFNLGLRQHAINYWKLVKQASKEAFIKIVLGLEEGDGDPYIFFKSNDDTNL